MTTDELWQSLIKIHDKIKTHTFREIFTNKFEVGYKRLGNEYSNLIYKSTELLCELGYRTKEFEYLQKDLWWVHNFRAQLWHFEQIIDETYRERFPTHQHDQDKTNLSNILDIMLWLEKYIGYLHRFIETKQIDKIVHVDYECQELPHNGWYYYHATEYYKDKDGEWKLTEPIQYVDKNYLEKLQKYRESREKRT